MPKISDRPLTRICSRLWSDDVDYLQQKARENPDTNFNFLVRSIVSTFVRQMRATENRMIDNADAQHQNPNDPSDLELLNETLEEEKTDV